MVLLLKKEVLNSFPFQWENHFFSMGPLFHSYKRTKPNAESTAAWITSVILTIASAGM